MAMPHQAPGSLATALAGLKVSFDPQYFRWRGVEAQAYKFALGGHRGMGWRDVSRFTLACPPVVPSGFELRYFELAAGGYSSLEQHGHVHCIVVLRGRGKALVAEEIIALEPLDVLYVPARTPHRWINDSDEPFGFLCPVDAQRDSPGPVDDAAWERLRTHDPTAPYVFCPRLDEPRHRRRAWGSREQRGPFGARRGRPACAGARRRHA